jgi:hypothetical protein
MGPMESTRAQLEYSEAFGWILDTQINAFETRHALSHHLSCFFNAHYERHLPCIPICRKKKSMGTLRFERRFLALAFSRICYR